MGNEYRQIISAVWRRMDHTSQTRPVFIGRENGFMYFVYVCRG